MRKDDVQTSYHTGNNEPMVNVKVYGLYRCDWSKLIETADVGEELDDAAKAWLVDYFTDDDRTTGDDIAEWLFEAACGGGWEMLQSDAEYVFGERVKVTSEGRSGGWCVVHGLSDIETWDAIMLGKWAKFEKYAKAIVDNVPNDMVMLAYLNIYEPERMEREAKHAAEAAEDAQHQHPYGLEMVS